MTERMSLDQFRTQTRTATKEKDVSTAVREYLDKRRIYNDRLNSGRVEVVKSYRDKRTGQLREYRNWLYGTMKGTPDRFAIYKGRIIFIELKRPGGKLRPDQVTRHEEIRAAGAIVLVADSIDSFREQFERLVPLTI